MKFIEPNAERITEKNPYKFVERIGRTCYKSEDKITEESCYKFVANLVKRQHFAMLEHARFSFEITGYPDNLEYLVNIPAINFRWLDKIKNTYMLNVSMSHLYNPKWRRSKYGSVGELFDTLLKVVESTYLPGAEAYPMEGICYIDVALEDFQYRTIKFVCDRGVSHELVRHRCAVAQESTRYCNYTKDNFGGGDISFGPPANYEDWDIGTKVTIEHHLQNSESLYNHMIEKEYAPQQARAILPNALKTEVILTMNLDQWKHFFDLRYKGTTGAPHPDMKVVAEKAYELLLPDLTA